MKNSVQILCKKTDLLLSLAKYGLEVSNGNRPNMKVVGNNKISQMGQLQISRINKYIPKLIKTQLREPPKGPTKSKEFSKIIQSYKKLF